MKDIIVLAIVYLMGIAILLIFNELAYRRLDAKGEVTRKFAHFSSILATMPFPYIFPSHWYVLVLALIFTAVLYLTKNGKQLQSIHDIERKSVGSYMMPISIYFTFLISTLLDNKFVYILPMLILAISDPMAAILGMNIKKYNGRIKLFGYKLNKTWIGSGAFLVSSFVISVIAYYFHFGVFDLNAFWLSLAVCVTTTLIELTSWRGLDNLGIPISGVVILVLFL